MKVVVRLPRSRKSASCLYSGELANPCAPSKLSNSMTTTRWGVRLPCTTSVAPPRTKNAPEHLRQFVYVAPAVGDVLLWESWLRHEVPMNMAEDERISVSFNYKWES